MTFDVGLNTTESVGVSKLVRNVTDADLSPVAILIASISEAINLIDQPARIRLAEFIRTGPEAEIVKSMSALATHPEIRPVAVARTQTFDIDRLATAIDEHSFGTLAKERALTLLAEARSWHHANATFSSLVMPLFEKLDRTDIERIIRMPIETGADLLGATGYREFIKQVRLANLIPNDELDALLRGNNAAYLATTPQQE